MTKSVSSVSPGESVSQLVGWTDRQYINQWSIDQVHIGCVLGYEDHELIICGFLHTMSPDL